MLSCFFFKHLMLYEPAILLDMCETSRECFQDFLVLLFPPMTFNEYLDGRFLRDCLNAQVNLFLRHFEGALFV